MAEWFLWQIIAAIPWYIWAVVAIAAAVAVWRLIGWQGLLAVVAVFVGVFSFKRGQSTERDRIMKKANDDADRTIAKAKQARDRANADNSDAGELLKSDGHRRD